MKDCERCHVVRRSEQRELTKIRNSNKVERKGTERNNQPAEEKSDGDVTSVCHVIILVIKVTWVGTRLANMNEIGRKVERSPVVDRRLFLRDSAWSRRTARTTACGPAAPGLFTTCFFQDGPKSNMVDYGGLLISH
ncbi:hypothetical protein RUM44_011811 [Polyplax serrata]|uniref:Uncharacterized protein n=1 Tax=Polyplax serrata TaxID=468196 RepID=A0ABR1ARR2_POLSC